MLGEHFDRGFRNTKPKIRLSDLPTSRGLKQKIDTYQLHTICESGKCPNKQECWGRGTATFMILGDICTRSCAFCGVKTGKPNLPDENEPIRLASIIRQMDLKHCVLTSVDRDDLVDGGSAFWAKTISTVKKENPELTIETLIPDFKGDTISLDRILAVEPNVISHNMETVKRLTKEVRIQARYEQSLFVLKYLSNNGARTKTGLMVGLGEREDEVKQTLQDIIDTGCRIVTIGQYFQPTLEHFSVKEYVHENTFNKYKDFALGLGFDHVESGALVRSSYYAEKHVL